MKAVVFHEHGGLEVLQYEEVPTPPISPTEALVKVRACALNHLDIWVRQGMPKVTIPLPHILGSDIAGEVAQVGAMVKGFQAGDRVLVAPGISCRNCESCSSGWDSLCDEYAILGYQVDGGYAEYVKVPAENLFHISERWSWEEWAAVPLVFLTAWHMLFTRAGLRPGETVLIHAAGSGVGTAAIQLAKLAGARVITTAGSDEKLAQARQLGADEGINYTQEEFPKAVRQLTHNQGVEVVFEHIGQEVFEKSLACLAKGGRLVTCGATSGPGANLDLRFLFSRQFSILGSYMGGRRELWEVLRLVETGRVRPVVDSVFPLPEAAAAQERMLSRKIFGKVVLTP
ncbi:MAG: zinc-binding dehydrogenase [Candidatus Tectomicrobia bacterium]|uniref:Zinc-binding dehydrogenase n=1 Tax=Tectimicrobiota bacterium TaxID=2528274 RepID=A0A932FYT1_UNCTE|nr:zinc-binding dehydrogenase [Candidatus Tectomicrobia bacterium]